MLVHKSHLASGFEFLAPLVFALLILRITTERLGLESAGVIILLVAISAFVVNIDITGGRSVSGFISKLRSDVDVSAFIGSGIILSAAGAVVISSIGFSSGYLYVSHIDRGSDHSVLNTFLLFSMSAISAQIASFMLWSRLGLGDSAGRSSVVIIGNIIGILASVALFFTGIKSQAAYSLPFIARDLTFLALSGRWCFQRYRLTIWGARSLWKRHLPVAMKAVAVSLTTALFEPLIKFYIAGAVSLDKLPVFEIAQRAFTSVRNGVVVFIQTYTAKIARSDEFLRIRLVQDLDYVVGIAALSLLAAGAIALSLIGDVFVAAPKEDMLYIYLPLVPAVALSVAVSARYIAIYVMGNVGRLLYVHIAQAIVPVFVVLFKKDANLFEIILVLLASYLLGALTTLALSWRKFGAFGGSPVLTVALIVISVMAVPLVVALPPAYIAMCGGVVLTIASIALTPLLIKKYRSTLSVKIVGDIDV